MFFFDMGWDIWDHIHEVGPWDRDHGLVLASLGQIHGDAASDLVLQVGCRHKRLAGCCGWRYMGLVSGCGFSGTSMPAFVLSAVCFAYSGPVCFGLAFLSCLVQLAVPAAYTDSIDSEERRNA